MARRRSTLLSPTALLRRNPLYKGALGGSRGWMAVGVVLWGPRLARKYFGKQEEVIAIEKLTAGQAIRLESIAPPTRRQRKAIKRAK
ncbi:MAG: hypothetical protein LH616_01710 [Ilumatobacteraceae bacterium]|nr:hypothetical protein [Ilumatobacteraceae bacterium]